MRQQLTLTILLVSISLGACGTRGPLTLPPPSRKPISPNRLQYDRYCTRPVSIDLNTAKEPS